MEDGKWLVVGDERGESSPLLPVAAYKDPNQQFINCT
jgi:hypothetical protein